MWRSSAAVAASALALAAAASAGSAARTAVVVGAGEGPAGFNPAVACCSDPWSTWMGPAEALRGAFVQTPAGRWIPDLVTSASANAKSVTYTIAPRASWYWGGRRIPVTYRDFVYTLRELVDSSRAVDRGGYAHLDPSRYTHRGTNRVTFFWRTKECTVATPCGPVGAWQSLFSLLYPSFALHGMNFDTMWSSCICGSDGKPVADGPYYLASYASGAGATLLANPFWSGRRPSIRRIDFRILPGVAAQMQALSARQVDVIAPPYDPSLEAVKTATGLSYAEAPGYSIEHLEFREGAGASNVLLRAPYIRQAIAMALDRDAMLSSVFGDLEDGLTPADGALFYPRQAGYERSFRRWNYNPRKALGLLARHCSGGPAAVDPANSAFWTCAGLPATFTWSWPTGDTARTVIEAIAKQELRAIGIQIVDRPLPPDVFFGTTGIPSGAFDIAEYASATGGDPSDWAAAYSCGGSANATGFCSHEVDRLLALAGRETSPALRTRDLHRAEHAIAALVPVFPLYPRPVVLVHASALTGPAASPTAAGAFWNVERWKWGR